MTFQCANEIKFYTIVIPSIMKLWTGWLCVYWNRCTSLSVSAAFCSDDVF